MENRNVSVAYETQASASSSLPSTGVANPQLLSGSSSGILSPQSNSGTNSSPSPPPHELNGNSHGSQMSGMQRRTLNFSSPVGEDYSQEEEHILEMCPSNRYGKLTTILGKGAYKVVWKALDLEEGIEVAWNAFQTTKAESAELSQEIEILKKVRHPNIIGFKDSWYSNGEFVFITELMNSGTLREYASKLKPSLRLIKAWSRQILKGLLYLHSSSPPIIHRDLKCDNIFINGAHGEVKIGDMGTAKMKFGKKYTVIGTPEFMAPEMYEEKGYSEKVDVYAFGMVLLELVSGDYPYSECKNAAQIYKKVSSGIKPECLNLIEDDTLRSLIDMCISPEHERPSVRQLFDHPFYVCEPDVILLAVDDMRYILTLQVVFRGTDKISVKFEYALDTDTPEEVVNEMIVEKVLQGKYKTHVVVEINRILRDFLVKFPFAMETIQQHTRRSSNESSLEAVGLHAGMSTPPPAERTIYLRHAQTQQGEEPTSSPSNLSWKRESQYKTEIHRMQKEVQRACDRAVEAEKRAKDLETGLAPVEKPPLVDSLSHTSLPQTAAVPPPPIDVVIQNDTRIEELVHEVAAHANRGPDKALEWISRLHEQDIMTVGDLKALHEEDWTNLNLTVFACRALKNAISGKKVPRPVATSPPSTSYDVTL